MFFNISFHFILLIYILFAGCVSFCSFCRDEAAPPVGPQERAAARAWADAIRGRGRPGGSAPVGISRATRPIARGIVAAPSAATGAPVEPPQPTTPPPPQGYSAPSPNLPNPGAVQAMDAEDLLLFDGEETPN